MKKIPIIIFCLISAGVAVYLLNVIHQAALSKGPNNQKIKEAKFDKVVNTNHALSNSLNSNFPNHYTNLPEHVQFLLQEGPRELIWIVNKKLTPSDKDLLLKLYKEESSLVKKRNLTIALGFIGDDEVVEVFKHTLADNYAGRQLSSNEEMAMRETVEVLGFLANKSDSAFELLKKGFDPKFWKEYCKFVPNETPGFYGTLTGDAIEAIGRSGRPDVTNILESLKTQPLNNYLDNSIMQEHFEGAVIDAAFYNDIIDQRGLDYYKYIYLNIQKSLEELREWRKNGTGRDWDKWYLERMKK